MKVRERTMKNTTAICVLALSLALVGTASAAEDPFARARIGWNQPMAPFHIIGNIFYVGTAGTSAFLISTPQGLILTDGGLPESAEQIEANIRALGFDIRNVKIMLNSHAHFDHAGALAKIKRDSGARMIASEADKPFLEKGLISFGPSVADPFPPVTVDRTVKDGDTVVLGGVTLTAHLTPGHTPGCTSWTMPIAEGNENHNVIFFCSITGGGNPLLDNKAYPAIARDYKATFAKLKTMDADIFLAPHGEQFGLAKKLAAMKANVGAAGAPNPFIDSNEFHSFMMLQEKQFDDTLARQQAAVKP
jgi:metallo-beta-lactamase class B